VFVTIGAGVLGYVAGDMAVGDLAVKDYVELHAHYLDWLAPIVGALFVVIAGNMIARQRTRAVAHREASEPLQGDEARAAQMEVRA